MSIDLMSQVWKSDAYSGGKLLVLLALADWASDDGTHIFPKMATLAHKARLSHRQAQNCIKQLRDDGVLAEVAVARRGRGTEYRLVIDRVKELHRNNCSAIPSGEADSAKGVQSAASVGVQSTSPPIEEPLVEPLENRHSKAREVADAGLPQKRQADPLENFPAIWAACQRWPNFPTDASEARMQAAYLRCKPDLPPDTELIACIAEQGYIWDETNRQRAPRLGKLLIPHPNTWLEKHHGWKLHIEAVRAEPARIAAAEAKYAAALSGIPASILTKMAAQGIGPVEVEAWFGGALFAFGPPPRFAVPTEFRRDYIRNNFRGKLERALGGDVVVDVEFAKECAA